MQMVNGGKLWIDHYYQIVKRGTEGGGVYVLGHKL